MKWRIKPHITLVVLAGLAIVAWVLARLLHAPFWVVFALCLVALLVNGFVATREDDWPGGFNHPTPRE